MALDQLPCNTSPRRKQLIRNDNFAIPLIDDATRKKLQQSLEQRDITLTMARTHLMG